MTSGLFPTRGSAAPQGRQIGQSIGPADSDHACIGSLPAVTAAPHPMVCIGQCDASHSMFAGQRDRPVHAVMGIQIARPDFSIPAFQRPGTGHRSPRFRMNINRSITNHGDEPGKAIQSVRVHTVASRVGEELGTKMGALRLKSQIQQYSYQSVEQFLIRTRSIDSVSG